jgi:Tfp pilus assembly protein PilN
MRPLQIDFRRGRRSWPWTGPLLLVCALGLCGDVFFSYLKVRHSVERNQTLLAKHDPRSLRPAKSASADEVALARDTVQRLSTPWNNLFGALEAAASDQVALLSIEPDAKTGTVMIAGDSKNYLAALTYVLNLSRAETLSKVQLVRHEVKQNEPQRPVGFSVSAAWQEAGK